MRNGRDALIYAARLFAGPILVPGSSQGGMVAMALAGVDERIAAVFAHNVLFPQLAESLRVTEFPLWLQPFHGVLVRLMSAAARVAPRVEIPFHFYLQEGRVFGAERRACKRLIKAPPLEKANQRSD